MKKKDCKIEALRFIAAIFIMAGHIYGGLVYEGNFPFPAAWYYVEFFLILTGFFTAKHFENQAMDVDIFESTVRYTLGKFRRFLPYTIPAVLLHYVLEILPSLRGHDFVGALRILEDMPYEMMFLSAANNNGSHLFTIWFLSSLFLMLPIVCLIVQCKKRYLTVMIAFIVPVIYYLHVYDYGSHTYPNQMVRAFSGLLLGFFVYQLSLFLKREKLGNDRFGGGTRILLTGILILTYLVPIVLACLRVSLLRIVLLCFIVNVALIFSEVTAIPIFENRLCTYLGKLSMPIYIWHLAIGKLLYECFGGYPMTWKVVGYFGGTILVSIVNLAIVNRVKRRQ